MSLILASSAADIVTGALLNCNAYSPAQTLSPQDGNVCLGFLNDLTDSLNNDEDFPFSQVETVFTWISGQYEYTVGNPIGGTFTGTLTGGSQTITGVAPIPGSLIVGSVLTALSGQIPYQTNALPTPPFLMTNSNYTQLQTTVTAIGTNTVTMSAAVTATPATNPDTITYTVPGNIPIQRPLRFRSGFTRASAGGGNAYLDYSFTFVDFDAYKRELLKNIQGPWPYIAAYQPLWPYGVLYVYPNPSSGYVGHIFSDFVFPTFTNTTSPYAMPPGYTRFLKKQLAIEIAPTYGKIVTGELRASAKAALDLLKSTNKTPIKALQYDTSIARSQTVDAGWILTGGFR